VEPKSGVPRLIGAAALACVVVAAMAALGETAPHCLASVAPPRLVL
jgi:hypothetical protein